MLRHRRTGMVYLTGDTHGDLDRFRHGRLRWLGKRDIVVVLGLSLIHI